MSRTLRERKLLFEFRIRFEKVFIDNDARITQINTNKGGWKKTNRNDG